MSINLNLLYHWAPRRLRIKILKAGLAVMSPSRPYTHPETGEQVSHAFPWICLGTTPSSAWGLVLDQDDEYEDSGGIGWDLWTVSIHEGDRLCIRGDFSPYVREVRVMHSLPPDRLWWVAERTGDVRESLGL